MRQNLSDACAGNIALILQEAVTNCIEHAFPDGLLGEIEVEVDVPPEGNGLLRVTDNGIGMSGEPGTQGKKGCTIIRTLASDIGGQVRWSAHDGGGTVLVVDFPPGPKVRPGRRED